MLLRFLNFLVCAFTLKVKSKNKEQQSVVNRVILMLQICVFFWILLVPQKARSQFVNLGDTIRLYMKNKPAFMVDFDSKNTFISGRGVPVRGIKAGITYKNKISYMLGWYFITPKLTGQSTFFKGTVREITFNTTLRMHYASLIAEYGFYRDARWLLYLPVQIGFGEAIKTYQSQILPDHFDHKSYFVPLEAAITGSYRVWKFVGLSGAIGYRRAFSTNTIREEDFNGLTYSLGIKIWIGRMCTRMFPNSVNCRYF
jgi:hypothetical protein